MEFLCAKISRNSIVNENALNSEHSLMHYKEPPSNYLFHGWLVGCFGFNGPLRQYFSLYRAVSQREGEIGEEKIEESKNVQTTPTRTYCKRIRPLPYCHSNCRTPRTWKFTQDHRTTRPPQLFVPTLSHIVRETRRKQ